MNIINHHPLREALVHQKNSHCQHLKFVENSMENLHTDVRMLKVNNFFLSERVWWSFFWWITLWTVPSVTREGSVTCKINLWPLVVTEADLLTTAFQGKGTVFIDKWWKFRFILAVLQILKNVLNWGISLEINLLIPMSVQDRSFLDSINTIISRQVMRIKLNINWGIISRCNTKINSQNSRHEYCIADCKENY